MFKKLRFCDTVAFYNTYVEVDYVAFMLEPGKIADLVLVDYYDQNGSDSTVYAIENGVFETRDGPKGEADLILAIAEQRGDDIIECMKELF